MSELIPAGTRVRICFTLLSPSQRPNGLPDDTHGVPYVVRVKGLLNAPGRIGETVTIRTPVGRLLTGILEVVQPADTHTFGRPHPALVEAVDNIRDLLEDLA